MPTGKRTCRRSTTKRTGWGFKREVPRPPGGTLSIPQIKQRFRAINEAWAAKNGKKNKR